MNYQSSYDLSEAEKIQRLRLALTPHIGPQTFISLLKKYGTAEKAIEFLPQLFKKRGKPSQIPTTSMAEDQFSIHHKNHCHLWVYGDENYPRGFYRLPDPPPFISLRGVTNLLNQKSVAIIGARNSSLTGKKIAENISREIGQEGYVTLSGLARGIDFTVHTTTLATGTIGVIAGGIDQIYPPQHKKLYESMYEKGLVLAESSWGTAPQANLFPKRNRIISILSQGVVVIEAAQQSGSLITARCALDQGIDVFVVPGSPLDPRYVGSNRLIQQGAYLVQNTQDILDVFERTPLFLLQEKERKTFIPQHDESESTSYEPSFHPCAQHNQETVDLENTKESTSTIQIIFNLIDYTPIHVDDLIRSTSLESKDVNLALMTLELSGDIIRHPGNRVSRCP